MAGSNCCLKEQSPATNLDGIMAYQGWELQVAWTANGFVMVEEYSSGNLLRLPELAKLYSSTVTLSTCQKVNDL